MEAQSNAFDKELKRLDTSIADLGDGSVGKLAELNAQFKGLDTTVQKTQETIKSVLGLMKKLSPDTPLLNFGEMKEIINIIKEGKENNLGHFDFQKMINICELSNKIIK